MTRSIRFIAAVALVGLASFDYTPHVVLAQAPQAAGPAESRASANGIYIVQMDDLPAVSYTGGVAGLPATKAPRGNKIDPNSPTVAGYAAFLDGRHNEAVARVGGRKLYDYRYSFNGFAAALTVAQAEALRTAPGVLAVTKDELVSGDTSSTPSFLGLDQLGGLWDDTGGVQDAGEGVIVGIIDSGIWPENESFSDRTGTNGNGAKSGKLGYQQIPGWHGKCTPGEVFPASKCNQKVIGAQRFNEAWGGDAGLKAERPWEFASPRDYNGHGSHTASTAAGNNGVTLTGPARVFGRASGMAPRARIAVYKALWSTQDAVQAQGFTSDLVAAIDQAVADGVDVINYSISGTTTNFLDPAEIAFLFAADAGVFVAASAGNSGPNIGTVAHPSPWITTVAAGTHNRDGVGSVTLGSGVTFNGSSLATLVASRPFIDSTAAGLPGVDATELALCFSASVVHNGAPVLDPVKVAGKIVLCDRGTNARVDKSFAVQAAGGAGMVLVNVAPNSLNADFHYVPTVHVADTARAALKAYAATAGATATINQATIVFTVPAPLTAAFSSRGPLNAGGGDLLKPDVIAPGQDIVAAVAPPGNGGLLYNVYSGTSMSSPHVAGLAALLRDLHPDWSPMMIKSALMTSASDVLDGPNTNPLVIFRQGGGHVRPNLAGDPGLVYDTGVNDWLAFLCGATTGVVPAVCTELAGAGYSLDPSDLNVASIAIGTLAGVQSVTRRVTNVSGSSATYGASVTGMVGVTTVVTPSSLTLAPGETGSFRVTFTRTTATLNAYTGGQLTWTDGIHAVRSPLVVRPVALAAPVEVSSSGGPINYNVTFGYSGVFTASPRGLVPAVLNTGSIADDPDDTFAPVPGPDVIAFPMTIPAGTTYARFALFDANVSPASDLDIYVYRGTTLVAASGGGTSQETANLVNPPAGDYTVYVHGFAVPGTANFTLFSWQFGIASAGNMIVTAPAAAVSGTNGTITLSFSGLAPGTKYLGSVAYGGVAGLPNPTIVSVTTP
jgi:subtilisin family serine protease